MVIYSLMLIFSFVVFLYGLYLVARDDIVLMRRNISLETVFNVAFLTMLVFLFSGRVFYILLNQEYGFFNPLVFFLLTYFPGVSLTGGIAGSVLFLLFYLKKNKFPTFRFIDFFSIAFLSSLPFIHIGRLFLEQNISVIETIFLPSLYFALFIFFLKVVYPKLMQGTLEHGSVGAFIILVFSLVSFLSSMALGNVGFWLFIGPEEMVDIVLFLVAIAFLIKKEGNLF